MTGKQVMEVPSSNIGNFENVFAICHRGVEIQKVISVNSCSYFLLSSAVVRSIFSPNINKFLFTVAIFLLPFKTSFLWILSFLHFYCTVCSIGV